MMTSRQSQIHSFMMRQPEPIRHTLATLSAQGGMLTPDQTNELAGKLRETVETLMARLLPLAQSYAVSPVSDYQVGAVVAAYLKSNDPLPALFLGANMEFPGQVLSTTLHAEQAAIMNAWHKGAQRIKSLAISANPCGYCRQFLLELEESDDLSVIVSGKDSTSPLVLPLSRLLPEAFDPKDHSLTSGLLANPDPAVKLYIESSSDQLTQKALEAAAASYAPYTRNRAGCAIELADGNIYTGRYAESVAFNPSISPLLSALTMLNMKNPGNALKINRAVLVEAPSRISQRGSAEVILQGVAPHIRLEYMAAKVQHADA